MTRFACALLTGLLLLPLVAAQEARPPIYLWYEPEWFDGVEGGFNYWTGTAKPLGSWGIAGPGISAEWSQGGESEWNSMGAVAEETKAECQRALVVPRAGKYTVWVRYVDHRKKTEPFRVLLEQGGKTVLSAELGVEPIVPPNDEYQLFWGFSFGWGALQATLQEGPATLRLRIDRAGEAWRQVDAVLLTDDAKFVPDGRAKPPFAYYASFAMQPGDGASWRGSGKELPIGKGWQRPRVAGRDFSMWTGIEPDPKWWGKQDLGKLKLYDVFFNFSPPADIREKFHKQFAGRADVPLMTWPDLLPGFYLGNTPDLSPGSPVRQWLERTKTPFYIMTNYASGSYTDKNGPETYAALTGPLAEQFLGYIHGEAVGTGGVHFPDKLSIKTRRELLPILAKHLKEKQAADWSKIYKTKVPESHWDLGISCLSVDSIALAHLFHAMGARTVGYEIDATNAHAPMRIAFERGAARQYGGKWINYASGNFGDACNYFTQNPVVPRGAPSWFHSKYAVTDGVSISWYRKLYYLNYLGGASAIYWEQSLQNQYILPGPGTHPIQLSPFGRATEDFHAFVSRLKDRGEPYTPMAVLLSQAHCYERVNNDCKMLRTFREDRHDLELRELFNVLWHPASILEGQPAAPDVQSMPSGVYGDIYDVLVDDPAKAKAIFNYPIVWAAGDVAWQGAWPAVLKEYVLKGGTLVLTSAQAQQLPAELRGWLPSGKSQRCEAWAPQEIEVKLKATTPFEVVLGESKLPYETLAHAYRGTTGRQQEWPLVVRHSFGQGAVITVLVPGGLGVDERAHPVLPYLMNGLTSGLLPVEVLVDGKRPQGEIMYSLNRTKTGYLVTLVNHRGIDKTQNGLARVARTAYVDVTLRTRLPVTQAQEMTRPAALKIEAGEIRLRVHPGDVQVVQLTAP